MRLGNRSGAATRARMSSTTPPQQGRFRELVSNVPLVTLLCLIINIVVYIADNLGNYGENVALFSISAQSVLKLQLYRLITASFVHGGLLHIGMNMMSLFALGPPVEQMFGTGQYFFIVLAFVIMQGIVYVAFSILLSFIWPSYFYQSAVGFSGVLFAMAVDEATLSPFPTRSVFGLFNVPTKVYPWIMLIVLQFILPGVSFVGHLAGIVVGFLHAMGLLKWLVPSMALIRKFEQSPRAQRIVRLPSYKLAPNAEVLRENISVRLVPNLTADR
jgi:membrane associated rhomboid family serine protease